MTPTHPDLPTFTVRAPLLDVARYDALRTAIATNFPYHAPITKTGIVGSKEGAEVIMRLQMPSWDSDADAYLQTWQQSGVIGTYHVFDAQGKQIK